MRLAIAVAGIGLALVAIACGADVASYVYHNEKILETLPALPGAEWLSTEHDPYYEEGVWGAVGWTTNVIYKAPAEMTDQDVVDFYVQNMGQDWQEQVEEVPIVEIGTGEEKGRALQVEFSKGTAIVSVNTDNMFEGGPHTFEVSIDHRGAER
ncbi:MAG: hypothetical protein JSU97_07240 [Dehalococcoidia bacterium]|nr:MAG: hypothetical protein JSU97_07240 [Dehalococcoidia bacterium]